MPAPPEMPRPWISGKIEKAEKRLQAREHEAYLSWLRQPKIQPGKKKKQGTYGDGQYTALALLLCGETFANIQKSDPATFSTQGAVRVTARDLARLIGLRWPLATVRLGRPRLD
jgi:hypothetical protein